MRTENDEFIAGSELKPIKTVVGENQVFKGLEIGLKSMKMGERSHFTI